MLAELALSAVMVIITVVFHATGLAVLSHILKVESRGEARMHPNPLTAAGVGFTLVLVLGLFVLHGAEIWFYGAVYLMIDAVQDLRTAIYFSTITYGAIGFSDVAMHEDWRLVSAIEGINGILLLGWSTAYFVTVVARVDR
jgi:hypothetical protein